MPKQYEAIRDSMIAEGKSVAAAKTSAAKIYNSKRKKGQPPVTRSENAKAAEKAASGKK